MAADGGGGAAALEHRYRVRLRRPCWTELGWCLLYGLLAVCTHMPNVAYARRTQLTPAHGSFVFTQNAYNVTVEENAPGKTYLQSDIKMGMYVKDPTLDIKFKVESGDDNKLFKAEARTVGDFCFLRLRTRSGIHKVINRERQEFYDITVKAIARYRSGPPMKATTRVRVRVLDANDLSPLFYPIAYNVVVKEDTELHVPLVHVTAEDADIGVNGEIYYSFQQKTDTFAIHPTSGEVTLTRPVSYIEQNYYMLSILAEDRGPRMGHGSRASTAKLEVLIAQVNQHAPKLALQVLPSLSEQGMVGTTYAMLYVTDLDYGNNGKIASVAVVGQEPTGYFRLTRGNKDNEHRIEVNRPIDREETPDGFNLTIEATDRGDPPRSSSLDVHIPLADINDQAPRFEQEHYIIDVDEVVPRQTPLLFVRARDEDIGKNAEVMYAISEGNDLGWFMVDQYSGLFSTVAPLDAETYRKMEIVVTATDRANRGAQRSSRTRVTVSIHDCNDNAPIFNNTKMTVSISEGRPVGTEVCMVSAYDLDQGDNGYVSYSIVNEGDTPFTIDHFTGRITTSGVLDYESMRRTHKLRVRASDWGEPFRRESEMIVRVKIRDTNDNRPMFEKVNCTGYLSRTAVVHTRLVTVSAIDFDAGNIISYGIIAGNHDNCFKVDESTGVISVNCDLRRLQEQKRVLWVTATDEDNNEANSTTVEITLVNNNRNLQLANNDANINCVDTGVTQRLGELLSLQKGNNDESDDWAQLAKKYSENLHHPEFVPSTPRRIEVEEGLAIGTKVATLLAEDKDHGYNGKLMYVISSGNAGGSFKMDTYTGELLVMNDIDRETQIEYALNISVYDMGIPSLSASWILEVKITDTNDNPPQFDRTSYAVSISEDVAVNSTIMQVRATDYDYMDSSSQISYSILSDTADFAVHPVTGRITVRRRLDREAIPEYDLVVQASDNSLTRPLASTVIVHVTIEDVNDNAPQFLPDAYTVRLREDLPVGTVIIIVTAHDPDLGGGGQIRYALTDGEDGKFAIDRETGTIRITNQLDFERKQLYNVTVRARDRGDPHRSSKCSVVVEVIDVNENLFTPRFEDFVFQRKVSENLPMNTSVMQIKAVDDDADNPNASPRDYQIVYSIHGGTGQGIFFIDQRGMIWTNEVLDSESRDHYWLTVYATDRGTLPRYARVEVLIEVEDVNDNLPQTDQPVYYPTVVENSTEGTSVVRIQGYDRDVSTTSLTYTITGGNPQGFFHIDPNTGLITTTRRRLDREQQEEHILEVTVSDNGYPEQFSATRVVVTVADLNDEEPTFTDRMYRVRIPAAPESPSMTRPLFRVLASDADMGQNANIDYTIKTGRGNGRFRIDAKTGMILSDKEFEAGSTYDLTIRAVDNGRPQKRQSARVFFTVVACPTTSSTAPRFLHEKEQKRVVESDPVGHMVAIMAASDEDGDKIWYSIVAGNEDNKFSIDPETGNILVAGPLDWETKRGYNITIEATDCLHKSQTWVHIKVLDKNDNRPQFTQSLYEVDITENTAPGASVVQVAATDRDEDSRLFYTIHSYTDLSSRTKFKVDTQTDEHGHWKGVITTLESLNREAVSQHELVVMVRDQGTPSKRNLARVIIHVRDHNDHAPVFLTPDYEARVYETSVVGTAVVQVQATDRDTGVNAHIIYSILTGNIGSAFSIDPELGTIMVAKPLDRKLHTDYELLVRATDGGNPPLSTQAAVRIRVTMADNAPPRFRRDEYTTEVAENEPAGSFAAVVTAICQSSVDYEISAGDTAGRFTINPSSGVVSTTQPLDYEDVPFYNLTIKGMNMVDTFATTTLLVHVIDQNDNSPAFIQRAYVGNVSEAATAGSVVLDNNNSPLVVKAVDADTNLNALLVYSIVEQDAAELFEIDTNTGAVRTKTQLDHEAHETHAFTVQVSDLGTPRRTADTAAEVLIHVADVNDSPPDFVEQLYSTRLLLPTYKDVAIVTVHAEDRDSDVNSKLTYSISGGDEDQVFTIDAESGAITVRRADRLRHSYELTVSVTDGTFTNICMVRVAVDQTQAAGLHFSKDVYDAVVRENMTDIDQVTVVTAVGHALNEHLTFAILNPTSGFKMGATSGIVQTTGVAFDRERRDNYTLVIEVSDQRDPPRVAHALLNVRVQDENDNAPTFVGLPYYAVASVDAQRGEVVKKVTAVDFDEGANGEIGYSLLDGEPDSMFQIHRRTGEISVRRQPSPTDHNAQVVLHVEASDHGDPPLRTSVDVPIKIMNKATPVFEAPFYERTIPENVPPHTAIITATAHSPTGQKLIFSISEGDIYNEFTVDFSTGAIKVIDHLDYEIRNKYELTLRATDVKTGYYAEAIIHIYLEDVNDQAPTFESQLYKATVSEAVGIGTSILTVSATDKDSGPNAEILYHIEPVSAGSNDSGYFHIDPERGVILTKLKIDHELTTRLAFLVVATDHGVPSMSSTVHVAVLVNDLNDNAPRFEEPVYNVTITDLVTRGQFVTMVTALDADSSDAGHLVYSIVGGNEKQTFTIVEDRGLISLSNLRAPDGLQPAYTLNVSVTDGVFTNFARVCISIQNSNNFVPVFERPVQVVDVSENLPPGQKVLTASATDDDLGPFGWITYSIGSEDAAEFFRMDRETGDLYTLAALDREIRSVFHVPVIATDGGGRSGHAFITVNVADQGDNRPQFKMKEYKSNIYSSAPDNAFVLQVSATDRDLASNAAVEYSFVSDGGGEVQQYFTIDSSSGVIRVLRSLTNKESTLFQFFVRATDKGSPPSDNEVPVSVYVMSPADHPPAFEKSVHTYFIPEDRPTGSIIATVSAVSNTSIVYSIVQGSQPYTNVPAKFGINQDGKMSVIGGLDRETTETFELTVKAETEATPPLVAYTHVTIQIMDINDNTPRFASDPYVISLAENAPVGAKVIQVAATDADAGVNADISYEFALENTQISNVFAIDPGTGWITTLIELDREDVSEYAFSVVATDRGQEKRRHAATSVRVTILDHNDEPPVFSEPRYKGAINEDALPGTIILTVTTTDRDLPENARVRYYITDGNPLGQFNIRSTGEVYVNKALDREDIPAYELTVAATDGAFVTQVNVAITVLDANDNSPQCEQPMYEASISENIPVGSFVIKVAATDADEQDTRNARVEYRIDGEGASTFSIHRKTGIITTRRNLDREAVAAYKLSVVARDGGGLECRMTVHATITDINDNEPAFTQPFYTISIPENAEVNTLLTRVSAVDRDLGINRKVRYAMKESNGAFLIDPISGIVSLGTELDREVKDRYNLTLYAYDQGTPKMTSVSFLIVHLLDINDNPPEFERQMYTHGVREDTHVGTSLMRVLATSRDTGINAQITYAITGGNEQGKFRIDSKTGAMAIIEELDYELAREFVLTVTATDGGSPPLSNTAVVRFNVTDANDNPPIFTQLSYTTSVREDVQTQHNIVQVVAQDADSAPNARLTYMIIGGDPTNTFTINRKDGFISVAATLDRETIPSYSLEVQAVDSGHPRLTGVVSVTIDILDANDNAPQFTLDNYTAVVQVDEMGQPSTPLSEDRQIGYSVLKLSVTDDDIDPNGPPFSYDIIAGNDDQKFRIDRQGHLSTVARFDRQIKDMYHLTVRVFDNGNPPKFTDTSVTVKIIEESAYPPVVTPLDITITALGDEFPGGVIGRVKAVDPDIYDSLRFGVSAESQSLFDIHTMDGTIQAVQSLDTGSYRINVSVTDGKYTSFTEVRAEVVGITQQMIDNAVVVRLQNVLPEEFIAQHRENLNHVLAAQLGVQTNDILILSIQPAMTSTTTSTTTTNVRSRRAADADLDILVAVRKSPGDSFFRGNSLRRKVAQMVGELQNGMKGVKVLRVFNDVCEKDTCDDKTCETEVRFMTIFTIITDNQSYVTARHALKPRCKCRYGARGCDMVDACNPSPCAPPQVCKLEGQLGYKCDCPEGKTGENCDQDVTPTCTEPKCNEGKPMTFTGQSYARWRLTDTNERRFSLQLSLKTMQASKAMLMYAVGRVDHSILEMVDGYVQYRFDCGSGEGHVRVTSVPVNDGNWHSINVERRGSNAELIVDHVHKETGTAPGTNDVLNLDTNAVYFGSEGSNPTQGFKGCMQDLAINGVALPYSGSTSVGSFIKFENIEFHCKRAYVPGVCSSSPCYNGGTCIPKAGDNYVCHCHSRFVGARCEYDTDPCASNPCKHKGVCENISNDYRCACMTGLTGKQCQHGFYCRRGNNPCQNGGSCTDGDSGPICACNGFEGEFCERDLDECSLSDSPCANGGTCINTHGSYTCVCAPNHSGARCEESPFSSISSTPFNITIEEIIGIAGVVLGLLLIVIIFVVVVRWRRRKRRERLQRQGASNRDTNDFIYNCDDIKRSQKVKNLESPPDMVQNIPAHAPRNIINPKPPPVPNRPASYTPSTADSVNTLNNFDTICNYGSAGDELENIGTMQHIEIPEFLQNVDVDKSPHHHHHGHPHHGGGAGVRTLPPPPPPVHLEDGRQKASWDHNNPNIAQNYPYDEFKKHHKTMPTNKNSSPGLTSFGPPDHDEEQDKSDSQTPSDKKAASGRGKKKGYHWDTSDWAPNPTLPNITELPMKEVPDSPSSSRSNDSNLHIDPADEYDFTDYHDDTDYVNDGNESEYVGDSEYAENEFGDGDDDDDDLDLDDPNRSFPEPPNFEHEILAMQPATNLPEDTPYNPAPLPPPTNYNLHPDRYLPAYHIVESGASQEDDGNGNDNVDNDDEDVIHYGFPRPKQPRFISHDYPTNQLDYNTDYGTISSAIVDDMSVSMGGYTSTNASCSDISGLCEIEDSEVNMSDNDSDPETAKMLRPKKKSKSHSHTHTQV